MAQKITKRRVHQITNAAIAALTTAVNTYLETFDGSGQPGSANQFRYVGDIEIFFDGTNYQAIINYSESVDVV